MTSVIQIPNVLSSESTHGFSVATSCHGCLNTRNLSTGSHQIYLEENQPLPLLCFLVERGPLNSVVPSTLPVTTMTWLLTARSITSATSRSGGRIKAGEDGDVFLLLAFSVLFLQLVNIYRSSTSVSAHLGCLWTQCVGICAAYPSGPAPLTSSSPTCPLGRGNGSRAARPLLMQRSGWSRLLHPKLCFYVVWQDGLKEEELGPLPVLSERNGPRVQAGLREGSVVDAGQEVLL